MKKIIMTLIFVANMMAFGFDNYNTSASFGVVSNYVYRGASQSNDLPAAQGSLNITYGNLYLGGFGTNIHMQDSSNTTATSEFDTYIGVMGPVFGGLGFNIGYIKYMFPEAWSLGSQEAYLGLRYLVGMNASLGLIGFYDIDNIRMSNYETQAEYDFGFAALSLKLGSLVGTRYYGSLGVVTHLADFEFSLSYKNALNIDGSGQRYEYFVYRMGKTF